MSATTIPPTGPPKSRTFRLDADSNGMSMTPEEFDAIRDYDERYQYELIRGVVVVSPIPSEAHDDPNEELGRLLRNHRSGHPQGGVLDETLFNRYVATSAGRRLADRVVWIGLGRRPDPKTDVPAIAVEFVSRSRRDRHRDYVEKRQEYREAGVKEYWIIDRFRRQMTVALADGTEKVVGEGETYSTPLLPGFELPLASLLARADAWGETEGE